MKPKNIASIKRSKPKEQAMQTISRNPNATNDTKPWYAHRWPWLLMLGPFIVVLAASYSGWLAFAKQDPLVVGDYYKQGKAINQYLTRYRVATRMGLSFDARYDAASGRLNGKLLGFGTPIAGKIDIYLAHSTQPEKDLRLAVQPNQRGEFSVALPMLERARWQVLVEGERRDWRLSGTWLWPQQQVVDIRADLPAAG
jgi:hypothetical protein